MSEAWMLELIGAVRDVARSSGMSRLAEHLDDAMLVAASEFHAATFAADAQAGNDGQGSKPSGMSAGAWFH